MYLSPSHARTPETVQGGGLNGKRAPRTYDTTLENRLTHFSNNPTNRNWRRVLAQMTRKEQKSVSNDKVMAIAHQLCFRGWWSQYKEVCAPSPSPPFALPRPFRPTLRRQ